jgi:hypothetical protein
VLGEWACLEAAGSRSLLTLGSLLAPPPDHRVDAPVASALGSEEQEDEAQQHGGFAVFWIGQKPCGWWNWK